MKKRLVIAAVVALVLVVTLLLFRSGERSDELVLHGNVDLRQVDLPFLDSERIAEVLVDEGDAVHVGQILARLDTGRLLPKVQQAEARLAAQKAALLRLKNGSRPEETAQARALLASAQAEAANAQGQYERLKEIGASSDGRAVSKQELDAAAAAARMGNARVENTRKALDLAIAGPRQEDIEQAAAQLQASEAELALLQDGVVRSRLMEPGELAMPQRPVLSLAISEPKWVRAYLPETALGRVNLGMPAQISVDSFPDAPLTGSVGFISSMAEFTPKTVQTEDLRTALVYEIRVFAKDPQDRLRLGMPATVRLDLSSAAAATGQPASTAAVQ